MIESRRYLLKLPSEKAEISRKVPPICLCFSDYSLGIKRSLFLDRIGPAIVLQKAIKYIFFLLLCFHADSDQKVLFIVWTGSVCLMSSKRTPCFSVNRTLYSCAVRLTVPQQQALQVFVTVMH